MASIVVLFVLMAPALAYGHDANDGKRYKEALAKAIRTSDRIVVTEHSDRFDFPMPEVNRKDLPQFEYGRVELSESAKAKFLKDVEAMDAKTQDIFPDCIFVPHHTIKFYSGSTLKSTMDICFHCHEIEWDGSKDIRSKGLWSAITPLIKDAGFHAERDWAALVKERRK